MNAELEIDELHRIQRLRDYQILDTLPEAVFDDLVELAAHIAATPIATITFIDEARQWFKSSIGLDVRETERSIAFCEHTIRARNPLLVHDTQRDSRFVNNPFVVGSPHLRFYAGFPIMTDDGIAIGTVAVMDKVPRELQEAQIHNLRRIARQAMAHLESRLLTKREELLRIENEQARAEVVALLESKERFYHLFKSAAAGIVMAHLDGRYIEANPAYCATVGQSAEAMADLNFLGLTHPEDRPRCEALVKQLALGEIDSFVIEKRYIRPDYDTVWVWATVSAVPAVGHKPQYLIAVTTNITEQRILAERLSRSETHQRELASRMTNVLESITDAFYTLDHEWRFTYVNREAERLMMTPAAELLGKSVWEMFPQSVNTPFYEQFQRAVREGQVMDFEEFYPPFDKWFDVRAFPSKEGLAVSFHDVTDRRKLEAQFLRAQRMESIGTLAGGIAHDLNNVLAPIIMSLGMLKQKERSPSELRLLNILEESAQRGAAMVRQVLSFARGVDAERTIVYLDRIIRDLVRLVRDTFDRKIRVSMELPSDVWPILGDTTQLHQLLLNLCVNARDAMPDGGELRLSVSNTLLDDYAASMNPGTKAGHYVVIKVTDNGTGMPPHVRERIFDPFFTTKEIGKGTGLGLSTAQAIVKSHDGFISVYSEEGRGTEFRIYLPATEDEESSLQVGMQGQMPRGHGEMILVVDDEERVRQVTQQSLEAFGYRVMVAEDGADALSVYVQHRNEIAVVLTDMMMPVMDGLAMIQALRKINPSIKIVAASGLADNGTVAKAANAGVEYFLPKPYAVDIMLRVLAEILEREGENVAPGNNGVRGD